MGHPPRQGADAHPGCNLHWVCGGFLEDGVLPRRDEDSQNEGDDPGTLVWFFLGSLREVASVGGNIQAGSQALGADEHQGTVSGHGLEVQGLATVLEGQPGLSQLVLLVVDSGPSHGQLLPHRRCLRLGIS